MSNTFAHSSGTAATDGIDMADRTVGRRATPAKRAEQPHFFGSRYIVLIRKKCLANFM